MRYLNFTLLVVCILLIGCSKKVIPTTKITFEPTYISDGNGTITMSILGRASTGYFYQGNVHTVIEKLEEQAFRTLFFRGLPGSSQETPLISINENKAISEHDSYFSSFFGNKRYKTFITTWKPSTLIKDKSLKLNSMSLVLTINLRVLRLDLEDNKVIKKFGF